MKWKVKRSEMERWGIPGDRERIKERLRERIKERMHSRHEMKSDGIRKMSSHELEKSGWQWSKNLREK